MKDMNKKFFLILTLVFATSLIVGFLYYLDQKRVSIAITQDSEKFREQIQKLALIKGQPIEGFSADILMNAFTNLKPEDFNNVVSLEGRYQFVDMNLVFIRKPDFGPVKTISSAEKTITAEGYSILFSNLTERLGIKEVDETVKKLNLRIENYEECIAAGNPMMKSNPPQCATPDGNVFRQSNLTPPIEQKSKTTQALIEYLARKTGISKDLIQIISSSEKEWPNSCLGLERDGEFCAQVITSGYEFKVNLNGTELIYRTNENGTVIRN